MQRQQYNKTYYANQLNAFRNDSNNMTFTRENKLETNTIILAFLYISNMTMLQLKILIKYLIHFVISLYMSVQTTPLQFLNSKSNVHNICRTVRLL